MDRLDYIYAQTMETHKKTVEKIINVLAEAKCTAEQAADILNATSTEVQKHAAVQRVGG